MVVCQGITEGGTAVPVQVTEEGRVVAEGQEGKEGPPGQPGPPGPQGEYGPGDDVDLGNITAAGTVTAAGDIKSGTVNYNSAANHGVLLKEEGYVQINSPEVRTVFQVRSPASDAGAPGGLTYYIDSDGTVLTRGHVKIGGTLPSAPNIELNASDGSATFLGNGRFKRSLALENGYGPDQPGGAALKIRTWDNAATAAQITYDGSITAAGDKCGFTAAGELFLTSRGTRYKLVVAGGLVNAEPYTRAMELKEKAEAARSPRGDSVRND